jgi:hypothetical protein
MSKKSDSKKSEILELITNSLENSSIHAIPNITRTESYTLKFMWILFLIGSTAYCAFLSYQSVMNYLSYDVVTLNRINSKKSVQFPMVTICNMNLFFSKELIQSNLNDSSSDNSNKTGLHKLNISKKKFKAIIFSIEQNETIKSKFGNNMNQTVLSCLYNFDDCYNDEDIGHYYDLFQGNCIRFNPKNVKQQSIAGSENGLQLELFTDLANDNNSIYSMHNGFKVFISDKDIDTYYSLSIKAPLGFSTDIVLNRHLVKKMPYPYSECKTLENIDSYHSQNYKQTFKYFESYNIDSCKAICLQNALIKKCNCVDLTIRASTDASVKPCLNDTSLECYSDLYNKFLAEDLYSNCDCPLDCNKNYYIPTSSIANFPSESYVNYILSYPSVKSKFSKNESELTYDYLKNRLATINVFYNELSENEITESAKMALPDLISNIGGILGLFLGILNFTKL